MTAVVEDESNSKISKYWECQACTYNENLLTDSKCFVCFTSKTHEINIQQKVFSNSQHINDIDLGEKNKTPKVVMDNQLMNDNLPQANDQQIIEDEKDDEKKDAIGRRTSTSLIKFPAPYDNEDIVLNCVNNSLYPTVIEDYIYQIPSVDEYYGQFNKFDITINHDKFSDGIFEHLFDENHHCFISESNDTKNETYNIDNNQQLCLDDGAFHDDCTLTAFRSYCVHRTTPIVNDKVGLWDDVNVDQLTHNNQILSALLGDSYASDGDSSDLWITLIAFCGYGSHRTCPITESYKHPNAVFVNDVTFLSHYAVRTGFEMYGAAAYFDSKYHLTEIYVSDDYSKTLIKLIDGYIRDVVDDNAIVPVEIVNLCHDYYDLSHVYKCPNSVDGIGSNIAEWNHAKWVWKVSVSVAVFLVDMLSHSLFRESNGLIKAIRKNLSDDHPIRRLLLPFTFGTVYCNQIFNVFLGENGLYHRAFAFQYNSLRKLIRDSMSTAPKLKQDEAYIYLKHQEMMYRFRLVRLKFNWAKKLPDEICPMYTDVWDYWVQTLKFVEEYTSQYYNSDETDDSELLADDSLVSFYDDLLDNLGIAKKYKLKKFNIINILTHFICNATIWNHHCNASMSFEYSMHPDFTGCKISGNYANKSNILNYVQYCLIVLSKGRQYANLQSDWSNVLLNDNKINDTKRIFKQYFINALNTVKKNIEARNHIRMAPYHGCNPQYLQSSIKL